jgi:hypothetical protein
VDEQTVAEQVAWDLEELAAAAAEQDPRKAFWLYVDGPTFATNAPDFTDRVLPAVADLALDAEAREAGETHIGGALPPGAVTYAEVLEYVGLGDALYCMGQGGAMRERVLDYMKNHPGASYNAMVVDFIRPLLGGNDDDGEIDAIKALTESVTIFMEEVMGEVKTVAGVLVRA